MDKRERLAEQFAAQRSRLRAVAYRMLGSLNDADDAVQEAWLRLSRPGTGAVENLGGWLTTVVARVCLDVLRSRRVRREEPLSVHVPDPIVSLADETDPEHEVLLADSVGLALLVVLERLAPAERLAFVLHDVFVVPFHEIAPIVGRSPAATRQLVSRARRRVAGARVVPDADLSHQREAVDAFLAAARDGDFDALVAVLDPDVVLRADGGVEPPGASRVVRGAQTVAKQALAVSGRAAPGLIIRTALVNGAAGIISWLPQALGPAYEHPERLSDDSIEKYLRPLVRTEQRTRDFQRFLTAFDNAHTLAIEDRLKTLKAPTLVVWGTDDVYFDVKWSHWLADNVPGTRRRVEFEGARIFFPEERWAPFNKELREHWHAAEQQRDDRSNAQG